MMTKAKSTKNKVWLLWAASIFLLAILFVCAVTFFVYRTYEAKEAEAQGIQRTLEEELRTINPPSSAVRVQHHSIQKSLHGGVSDYYQSDLQYSEIRAYYDGELSRHGWKFQKESKLTSWGEERGELMAFYCKGPISAEIYYTGQEE